MNSKKNPPLVRARFIIPALVKLKVAGGDVAALARSHGLSADDVWNPEALLPSPQCNALLSEITNLLDDPYLGATIGMEWAAGNGPPFEDAKRRATNLGHLLTLIAIEFSTEATTGKCELKVNSDYAVFTGQREYQPGETAAFGAAAFVSFIVQLIRQCVGKKWDHQVMMVVAPNHGPLPADMLPKGSVLTGPDSLFQFRFPVDWLDEPTGFASGDGAEIQARSDRIEADLVSSVRSFLRGRMPDGETDIAAVARAFSFPVREFQHRLKARSVSFRELLLEAKMEYAEDELRNPEMEIKELAERLGYSKVGNFSRAFKSQTGRTPSDQKRWS